MSIYSARVTVTTQVGTIYTETVDGDDTPGNATATYGLADPLTITQRLTDDARLPMSHPEPDEATFQLIGADNATYQDLRLGDQVALWVWPGKQQTGTPVAFYGRVAGLSSQPHRLGVLLSVSCVDYTADLAELTVGTVNYPLEANSARMNRITDEAGIPRINVVRPGGFVTLPDMLVAARNASPTDAYSALRELFDSTTMSSILDENGTAYAGLHSPQWRAVLTANITNDALDSVQPFTARFGLAVNAQRIAYAPPLRVANVAGVYTVTADPANDSAATGTPIISARRVVFAPAFTQLKGGGLANVTVGMDAQGTRVVWDWRAVRNQWAVGGSTWGIGGWNPYYSALGTLTAPQVLQEVDSILDASYNAPGTSAGAMAQTYRVPFATEGLAAWAVGTMSWQTWAEPTTVYAWTGTPDSSTSVQSTQDGRVEVNLHRDPMGAGPGTLASWTQNAGGTLVLDAANAWRGVGKALKVTTTVDNWGYLGTAGTTHGGTVEPLLVAGRTYTFRCMVKSDTAQTVRAIQYGSNAANGASAALVANVWQLFTVTWTQGATGFLSIRRADATPLVGNMWLSGFMVEEASSIAAFWRPGDPVSPATQWRRPQLTELLTVAGAQAGKLPNVREWLSGHVKATALRVEGGRHSIDVDLTPPRFDFVANREQLGSSLGVASMDSPILTGVTLAQLNARDSFNDYTLVRGS